MRTVSQRRHDVQPAGLSPIAAGVRGAWCLCVILLLQGGVLAQADEPVNPLASASALRCRFVLTTAAAWTDGKPTARLESQEFDVLVSDIDIQDGTAAVRGPAGRRFASVVLSSGSLYIMQIDRGELNVTSVFATAADRKRLKASHTRQNFVYLTVPPLNETPVVTQSYGDCEVIGP